MSVAANKWLGERIADVPDRAMKTAFLLAEHHNGTTGQCNPSHVLLAKKLGCSTRTVERRVAELREAGLVRTYQRSKGRERWETMAYVLVPHGGTVPKQWRPPGAKRTGPPDNKLSGNQAPDHPTDSGPSTPTTTRQHVGGQTVRNSSVSQAAAETGRGEPPLEGYGSPSTKRAGDGEGEAPSTHPPPHRHSFDSSYAAAVANGEPGNGDAFAEFLARKAAAKEQAAR